MRLRTPRPHSVAHAASAWGLACLLGCSGTHARPDAGTSTQGPPGSSACADTMFDPHNCGACGHDCGGGACQNGSCAPLGAGELATGQGQPGALVVDDAKVYWANADPPAIVACAKSGCGNSPTVLAQGTWGPASNLVLVGKDLYWGGGAAIYHCSTAGCGGNPDFVAVASTVRQVIVDPSGATYFIEDDPGTGGTQVVRCAAPDCDGGGAPIAWLPDGGTPLPLASPNSTHNPVAMAVDPSRLYILGAEGPFSFLVECAPGACGSTAQVVGAILGGTVAPILAVDSTSFYVVQGGSAEAEDAGVNDNGNASVGVVQKTVGGDAALGGQLGGLLLGSVVTLIGGLSAPSSLVVDGQAVYVADWGDENDAGERAVGSGRIVTCPLAGCGQVGATLQDYLNGPTGIAVDGTNVYWTERSASGDGSGPASGRVAFRAK